MNKTLFYFCMFLSFSSCLHDKNSKAKKQVVNIFNIANPVKGTMDAKPWEYKSAKLYVIDLLGDSLVELQIADDTTANICETNKDKINFIGVSLPAFPKVGMYTHDSLRMPKYNEDEWEEIGEGENDIFIRCPKYSKDLFDEGWSVKKGFVEIKSIENNIIEGYLVAYYNEEFNVKGNFRAIICY